MSNLFNIHDFTDFQLIKFIASIIPNWKRISWPIAHKEISNKDMPDDPSAIVYKNDKCNKYYLICNIEQSSHPYFWDPIHNVNHSLEALESIYPKSITFIKYDGLRDKFKYTVHIYIENLIGERMDGDLPGKVLLQMIAITHHKEKENSNDSGTISNLR